MCTDSWETQSMSEHTLSSVLLERDVPIETIRSKVEQPTPRPRVLTDRNHHRGAVQ